MSKVHYAPILPREKKLVLNKYHASMVENRSPSIVYTITDGFAVERHGLTTYSIEGRVSPDGCKLIYDYTEEKADKFIELLKQRVNTSEFKIGQQYYFPEYCREKLTLVNIDRTTDRLWFMEPPAVTNGSTYIFERADGFQFKLDRYTVSTLFAFFHQSSEELVKAVFEDIQ